MLKQHLQIRRIMDDFAANVGNYLRCNSNGDLDVWNVFCLPLKEMIIGMHVQKCCFFQTPFSGIA